MKKSRRLIVTLSLSTLLVSCLKPVVACGPFEQEAVLSYSANPDLPLKRFLDGEIGVIRPTWKKSYLVVAYRTLSNKPFTARQGDAVYKLWRSRIQASSFSDDANSANQTEFKPDKLSSLDLWMKERGTVPDTKPVKIEQERSTADKYDTYLNCPDNTFDTAADNLKKKILKHGATSAFVKDWVAGQDLVFCHCGTPGGRELFFDPKKSPAPSEPPFPALVTEMKDNEARQDRAYQHAAALFYAEQYDKALKEFSEISSDLSSPYAKTSRYMMPRCLIRKATMTKLSDEGLHSTYADAEKLLRAMITDSGMVEWKRACEDLLGFVLFRSEPTNRLKELSAQLTSADNSITSEQYTKSLDDYTRLLDSLEGAPTDPYETRPEKMQKVPTISKDDDLSNWIVTWERNDSSCFPYALERWHQTRATAWLLAAMHVAPADKKQSDELLQAARSVQPDSPAYLSSGYESALLHLRRAENTDAIKEAEDSKSVALKKQLWSAANLFMDVRGKAPIDTSQFVENSVRVPATFAFANEYLDEQFSPTFNKKKKRADFVFGETNAAYINERVPLEMIVAMSSSDKLPVKLRADAEQAAWVRAVMLNDYNAQDKLLPALQRDYPKLSSLIKATATGSEADRKFAATYLILKNPGMRPYVTAGTPRQEELGKLDTFSDNWWSENPPYQDIIYADKGDIVKSKVSDSDYPNLLTSEQHKQGLSEKKQLLASGAAPTFLCTVVADYAATHKGDPRVPEALHLAVRASHYGPREKRTTPMSKKCFGLLHTNYPKSSYAADTPYYY